MKKHFDNFEEPYHVHPDEILIRRTTCQEIHEGDGLMYRIFINGKELENIKDFSLSLDMFGNGNIEYKTTTVVPFETS